MSDSNSGASQAGPDSGTLAAAGVSLPADILDFWFGPKDSEVYGSKRAEWFTKSDAFDDQIRQRFGATIEAALAGRCQHWAASEAPALDRVAYIIVLDQFTRNVFRNTARMVAGDALALACARALVDEGVDREVPIFMRQFCYLPFEHAEDLPMQRRSLALFAELSKHPDLSDLFEWARKHQVIIERFGRFPHRNAILGRESTAEEVAFLAEPNSSF